MPLIPDSTFILNPTGTVSYPVWPTSGNFSNVSPARVATPIPGQVASVVGPGTYDVTSLISGKQGSIKVAFVASTAGTARALAFLAQSSTAMLGVALDSSNKPYVVLKDQYGTTVGQSSVSGVAAVASGYRGEVTLSWNSKGVVLNGRYASFVISGGIAADWGTAPEAEWDHLTPTSLNVGSAVSALSLSSFNGTILYVEVGNQVVPVPEGTEASEVLQAVGAFAGTATASASTTVAQAAASTMPGTAAATASATAVWSAADTMAGSATSAAPVRASWVGATTLAGTATVTADATVTP